jgi:hypothetical protein
VIDDVVLTARFNQRLDIHDRRGFVRPRPDPSGATHDWHYVPGPGYVVMACPATSVVELKLSIPRLVNGGGPNYPLRDIRDLDLSRTVVPIFHVLFGSSPAQARGYAARWEDSLWLSWGVRRIAYSMDVRVDTIPASLDGLAARSRRGAPPQRWGQPVHALQWDGGARRVQIYSKRDELLGRIRQMRRDMPEAAVEDRQRLADEARNIVRFEVTLKNALGVRELAGVDGGWLPNLRWMARDEVGACVLGGEAKKLKLDELAKLDDVVGTDLVALVRELGDAVRRASGRTARLSGTTVAALALLHQLRGVMSDEDIQRTLDLSPRTFANRRRQLEALNLPAMGTADPSGHTALRQFARAVMASLVDIPDGPPPVTEDDIVEAPWADQLPDGDHGKVVEAKPPTAEQRPAEDDISVEEMEDLLQWA